MRIHIVIVSVLLASCSSSYLPSFTPYRVEIRQGNLITQDMRAKLKLGMTQNQVRMVLGAPLINDAYHANRWDYFYSLNQQGKLMEKQRLTLYFTKDALTRIDDATPLQTSAVAKQEANDGKN
jgi:outer membrane protein assembly factor BamE